MPTSLAQPFPSHLGLSLKLRFNALTVPARLSSFNELLIAYPGFHFRQQILMHSLFTDSAGCRVSVAGKSPNGAKGFLPRARELFTTPNFHPRRR